MRKSVDQGGFLSRWLDYCEPFEFPDSYGLFSLLACASAAVNGRVVVNPGGEPSPFTNMFVVLYGPSGSRKGTAMRKAMALLAAGVPDTPILPDDFTMEALVGELSNQSASTGKCSGFVVQEEFADLIGGADYAKRNSKLLTKLWDARPVASRLTHAHSLEVIKNPYITVLASSSPDWLQEIDPKMLAGGFLRRLLLIVEYCAKRMNPDPKADAKLFDGLAKDMAARIGRGVLKPSMMKLTPEADARMSEWYRTVVKDTLAGADERVGHFASCMQAHMLKVAGLVNLLEGRGGEWLTLKSLESGCSLVEALLPGLTQAYASLVPTPYARLRAVILRTVQAAGESGISFAALDGAVMAAAGVKMKEVVEARTVMLHQGMLEAVGATKVRVKNAVRE